MKQSVNAALNADDNIFHLIVLSMLNQSIFSYYKSFIKERDIEYAFFTLYLATNLHKMVILKYEKELLNPLYQKNPPELSMPPRPTFLETLSLFCIISEMAMDQSSDTNTTCMFGYPYISSLITSKKPNCMIIAERMVPNGSPPRLVVIALRDLAKGEVLKIDKLYSSFNSACMRQLSVYRRFEPLSSLPKLPILNRSSSGV